VNRPAPVTWSACWAQPEGTSLSDSVRLSSVTVTCPDAAELAATEARVLAAGATRYQFQPNADHCLVFSDPAGTRSA
jgi:hypothetical protein